MDTDFLKVATNLIEDGEKKLKSIEDEKERLDAEARDLRDTILKWHEMISAYMNKYNVPSNVPNNFKLDTNRSYPEMLQDIAKSNNGILNVSDAVELLFKANVGKDRKQIQHNIYNTVIRGHFVKVGRGQYRFTNHVDTTARIKTISKNKRNRVFSGIEKVIKELKEKNPQFTRDETLKCLQDMGFDFKGRDAKSAVRFTWAKLGYPIENKQQPLLRPDIIVTNGQVTTVVEAKVVPAS